MQNSQAGSILLVDDEPELLQAIAAKFKSQGLQVSCASDGIEALEFMKKNRPDAILSDIQMPNKTGIEWVSELRAMGIETPCVFHSGYPSKDNLMNAVRLGVVDFLEKPCNVSHLVEVVLRAVQLGIEVKRADLELEELLVAQNVSASERASLKRRKLAGVILRHNTHLAGKKSA